MNVMTATSLPSSISETSSILSSISSCCSHTHDTTTTNNITNLDIDPNNNNNNNNNNSSSNNNNDIQQTSLQFILNQNNNDPLDYWEFNDYSEEEDEEFNDNNYYYYDSCYPDSHFDPSQQFNSEYYNQYTSQNFQNQYSSNGKLVPPPPSPPIEMDLLEDNQILSPDEFNSIFESFTAVVEGYSGHNNNNNNSNNNFIEDGCLRSVNCTNGFLDDDQLSQALGAIAMI